MTKPFHAGRSSESGIVAAQLAASGWTATDRILEAPRGFFQAAGGGYDAGAIQSRLGAPWTFADPGISIKPHPSGSLTHPGMTEMARLIREHGIKATDVERVRVGTNSNMPNALIHHRPQDELQAKFSRSPADWLPATDRARAVASASSRSSEAAAAAAAKVPQVAVAWNPVW